MTQPSSKQISMPMRYVIVHSRLPDIHTPIKLFFFARENFKKLQSCTRKLACHQRCGMAEYLHCGYILLPG